MSVFGVKFLAKIHSFLSFPRINELTGVVAQSFSYSFLFQEFELILNLVSSFLHLEPNGFSILVLMNFPNFYTLDDFLNFRVSSLILNDLFSQIFRKTDHF